MELKSWCDSRNDDSRSLLIAPLMELKYVYWNVNWKRSILLIAPLMELKSSRIARYLQIPCPFNRTAYGIEIGIKLFTIEFYLRF